MQYLHLYLVYYIYYSILYFVQDIVKKEDKNIISLTTNYIIDVISIKYNINDNYQWKQNNYRDLKGAILLLLPFIDDKSNGYLLKKLTDLNQLLYAPNGKHIPKNIEKLCREEIIGTYFEFGNMGIGLIPLHTIPSQQSSPSQSALDLYKDGMKTIYHIIYHNFISFL